MTKLTKREKNDLPILDKLKKELKNCLHCLPYTSMDKKTRYRCDLLPSTHEYTRLTGYTVTSFNRCEYIDMIRCPLLGNSEERLKNPNCGTICEV